MTDLRSRPWSHSSGVYVLSSAFLAGCGGSAGAALDTTVDSGSDVASATSDAGAGSGFNPGSMGSLVGSTLPDAGSGTPTSTDAGGLMVSPQVVDGCSQLCTKEGAASCAAFGSVSSCMVGCELLVRNPACSSAAQNLFSCVGGATASCDSSGNATFTSCGLQELASGSCFIAKATDQTLEAPCTTYCAAVAAAKCPSDNPNGCVASCQLLGNLLGCDPAWTQYVTCANGSTLSCGSDGKAGASACIAQAAAFWECAASGLESLTADDGGT